MRSTQVYINQNSTVISNSPQELKLNQDFKN